GILGSVSGRRSRDRGCSVDQRPDPSIRPGAAVRSPPQNGRMSMAEQLRIGFVGVGLMGHGMARNLLEKGFPVAVLGNRSRGPVEDLKARGAAEEGSARALAEV